MMIDASNALALLILYQIVVVTQLGLHANDIYDILMCKLEMKWICSAMASLSIFYVKVIRAISLLISLLSVSLHET